MNEPMVIRCENCGEVSEVGQDLAELNFKWLVPGISCETSCSSCKIKTIQTMYESGGDPPQVYAGQFLVVRTHIKRGRLGR